MVSHILKLGLCEAIGLHQTECFAAGVQFASTEGILPAPEANHAVAAAIREAARCREEGTSRAILFNLCGHGHFDMSAYTAYLSGELMDYEYPAEEISMALAGLPSIGP
jgi:tryptophan synthase beta chain